MISHLSHVMTLANGIIGVSVLAMPFCFKQCGIILAIFLLLLSSILSRLTCHFLVKSAVMSRRRNFEFLAFHAFGRMGKFLVELFIILFLLGTCIAFFVVVGDLGPEIIRKVINKSPEDIRTSLLITTGVFIVLPLGLLRNIDSLSSISIATIVFYICLVLKVIGESTQHIFDGDWYDNVIFWRPAGILQCLPIFSMALFCQTQLFEIYESVPNASLEKMNEIVRSALNICTGVYVSVGLFGYIACCTQPFTGNILMCFEPSASSEIIKLLFVFSVVFSFPLVIFPCRASLNSLLFRRAYLHETSSSYMPETRFRFLTSLIVIIALIVGILIPNIEFVLGIVGATIGVIICLIFPAAFFISISSKNTNERLLAQAIVFIGFSIMVLGTYVNLHVKEEAVNPRVLITTNKSINQINNVPLSLIKDNVPVIPDISNNLDSPRNKDAIVLPDFHIPEKSTEKWNLPKDLPVPVLPIEITQKSVVKPPKLESVVNAPPGANKIETKIIKVNDDVKEVKKYKASDEIKESNAIFPKLEDNSKLKQEKKKVPDSLKNENLINSDAIKKEESELAADGELAQLEVVQRHEELKKTLEKHKMEQREMMQEQKEILKDIKEYQKEQKELLARVEKKGDQGNKKEEMKSVAIEPDGKQSVISMEKSNRVEKENLKEEEAVELKKNPEELDTKVKKLIENKENEVQKDNVPKVENNVKNLQEPLNPVVEAGKSKVENEIRTEVKSDDNRNLTVDKKSSDHILNALTSNKIILENTVEGRVENKIETESKADSEVKALPDNKEKETNRLQEYSIPIALKMNNQTKGLNNPGGLATEDKKEFASARRDILENHEREKREVGEQVEISKIEVKGENDKSNGSQESCAKKSDELPIERLEKEPLNEDITKSLIKANVYLSQQSFTEKISIGPNLAVSGELMQLKKRDLKSVKSDEDGGL